MLVHFQNTFFLQVSHNKLSTEQRKSQFYQNVKLNVYVFNVYRMLKNVHLQKYPSVDHTKILLLDVIFSITQRQDLSLGGGTLE